MGGIGQAACRLYVGRKWGGNKSSAWKSSGALAPASSGFWLRAGTVEKLN